jgi:L-alanine-DL-glutamate epimerase-like enolase superfamily enzyme
MKIVDVVVERFRTTSRTVADDHGHAHPGPERESSASLLKIVTDDGAEGYCLGADREVLERVVKPRLLGEHPYYRERIWQHLRERQRLNKGRLNDGALAAVDLALWDLEARRTGVPLAALLGAAHGADVALSATIAAIDRAGAAAEAAAATEAGLRCLKLKVGVGDDAGRLAAVRATVGQDVSLRIDANGAWSVQEAVAALGALAPVGLELVEEPVHGLEALRAVREVA